MNNKREGFTLIELLVAVAIFVIVIGIPYKMFISELKVTLQENSKARTEMESVPSVEVLRKDIEMAGYGLPWDLGGLTYSETMTGNFPLYSENLKASLFNDAPNNPPRAIVGKKDNGENGFSYLVLKGTIFGLNKASVHWTYIDKNNNLNIWPVNDISNYNNIQSGDRVVILSADGRRKLTANGSNVYFQVAKNADPSDNNPLSYGLPYLKQSVYLIYGVDTDNIRAPFNRIDYFLYDSSQMPIDCAEGTHILERVIMNQSNGDVEARYPLLHCVADFQVGFGLDTNEDGVIDKWIQDLTSKTSEDIRKQLKQVRVYILLQSGKKDNSYKYPNNTIYVGDLALGIGRSFDLFSNIKDYQHYRWKLIKLVVIPRNLE